VGKTKFYPFWPPPLGKTLEKSTSGPPEKILSMPNHGHRKNTLSYSKFESIQLQREESAENFNGSRKMFFIL